MELKIRLVESIQAIGIENWRMIESPDFPFNDFEFHAALEESRCVGKGTGWQPLYIVCEDYKGDLLGAMCAYVKQHSYGEYIFDWQWANFFDAHGVDYYPKLLTAVPFTPATGPRILLRKDADPGIVRSALISSALDISQRSGLSSYHALFIEASECDAFRAHSLRIRHSIQYHWQNLDYRDFQDFLDSLIGKRRRDILRERARAQSHGLSIRTLTGEDLTQEHARTMEKLYQTTTDKKNAIAYLQPQFFEQIFQTMKDRIVMILAMRGDEPVAAALNFYKGQKLYGRYWGSHSHYADLHFELCYYQTIDFAVQKGLQTFEAGAQGEHKVQRGFRPSLTYSAHAIFDARLAAPIESFIEGEKAAINVAIGEYSSPFKTLLQKSPTHSPPR